jgi:TolB-like protein
MKKPLAILLLLFSFASAQKIIAVIDFDGKGISQSDASALTDRFRSELFNADVGRFKLLERDQMEDILTEQGFQQTGCVSSECAVEAGKMLGAEQIITGSISKVGEVFSVSARIIDVKTGEIVEATIFDYEGRISGLLTSGMKRVAMDILNKKGSTATSKIEYTGILYINTTPNGARVTIDDVEIEGQTPIVLEDQPTVEKTIYAVKGGLSGSTTVTIKPVEITNVNIKLEARKTTLNVFSEPLGAKVFLENVRMGSYGETPITIKDLAVGSYQLKLIKNGYVDHSESISIGLQGINKINATLKKLPTIEINSIPSSASIKVRGQDTQYKTPHRSTIVPGNYVITLSREGYDDYTANINVEAGKSYTIDAELVKSTGSLEVHSSHNGVELVLHDKKGNIFGRQLTPSVFQNVPVGDYRLIANNDGYIGVEKEIEIKQDQKAFYSFDLISKQFVEKTIKKNKRFFMGFLIGSGSLAGYGGQLRSSAEKHYNEYLSAEGNATDLHKMILEEDSLSPTFLTVGSVLLVPTVYFYQKQKSAQKMLNKGAILGEGQIVYTNIKP